MKKSFRLFWLFIKVAETISNLFKGKRGPIHHEKLYRVVWGKGKTGDCAFDRFTVESKMCYWLGANIDDLPSQLPPSISLFTPSPLRSLVITLAPASRYLYVYHNASDLPLFFHYLLYYWHVRKKYIFPFPLALLLIFANLKLRGSNTEHLFPRQTNVAYEKCDKLFLEISNSDGSKKKFLNQFLSCFFFINFRISSRTLSIFKQWTNFPSLFSHSSFYYLNI